MSRKTLVIAVIAASSLLLISCGEPTANNATNKPANAATNSAATAPVANSSAIEADLKKATTDMAASLVKNDVAAIEKVYSENYMFVGPDGSVSSRSERVEAMKTGDTKYESLTYDEMSVRSNPEGTGAVVISRATVKGKNMGKAIDGQYRVTHVWAKTKDGWRMVNGQTTSIIPTAATANTAANNGSRTTSNTAANANK